MWHVWFFFLKINFLTTNKHRGIFVRGKLSTQNKRTHSIVKLLFYKRHFSKRLLWSYFLVSLFFFEKIFTCDFVYRLIWKVNQSKQNGDKKMVPPAMFMWYSYTMLNLSFLKFPFDPLSAVFRGIKGEDWEEYD